MGKELYEQFEIARCIFRKANEILGFDLDKICFEGPKDELTKSAICQPAILTLSIAAYEVWQKDFKANGLSLAGCAGLSLGEYSALVACGSLQFEDAVKLVNKRGEFMDEASRENPGTMSCILGLELEKAKRICQETNIEIANLNCPGQIVVSGKVSDISDASERAYAQGAKKVIKLQVNGPFHSSLMSSAAAKLELELENVLIKKPNQPFLSNITADYVDDEVQIKDLLIKQVANTTFWERLVLKMKESGITIYFEIGPGKILKGLLGRIDRDLVVINLEKGTESSNLEELLGEKL